MNKKSLNKNEEREAWSKSAVLVINMSQDFQWEFVIIVIDAVIYDKPEKNRNYKNNLLRANIILNNRIKTITEFCGLQTDL